jgi:hypothetical protein
MTYHTELAVIINIRTKVATQGNLRKKNQTNPPKAKRRNKKEGLVLLDGVPSPYRN